jgi:hypothetical protein
MSIKINEYTSTGRTWLDSGGFFLFGKYKNSLAEDIAKDDPSYVKWIVESVEDICEEDREMLSQLLTYRNRRRV